MHFNKTGELPDSVFCSWLFSMNKILQSWGFNEEPCYFSMLKAHVGSTWCSRGLGEPRAETGPVMQTSEVCRLLASEGLARTLPIWGR